MLTAICEALRSRGITADVIEKDINNGVTKKGISILIPGKNNGPVLYEDWIENYFPGKDPEMVAASLEQDIRDGNMTSMDVSWTFSKDFFLENSSLRAVRKDWNEDMIKELIWRPIGGSDLVWYVIVNREDTEHECTFSAKVTKQHLELLELSEEELFEAAQKNAAGSLKIMSMKDVIRETLETKEEHIPDEILDAAFPEGFVAVLTNTSRCYGAGVGLLPDSLEKARKKLRVQRMTVIPSSIHEIMCFPIEVSEEGGDMVKEVNQEHVIKEEWLSDHPFIWDGKTLSSI